MISKTWPTALPERPLIRLATSADLPAIRALCREYRKLLADRSRHVPAFVATYYGAERFETLLADLPRLHAPPDGAIYVAGDPAVGCAMIHRIDDRTCEIKRVFVSANARGSGAGRALFEAAMSDAKARGYGRMVLDTFHTLTEAMALYDALGFRPARPFYDPEPDLDPYIRFYEKPL